MISNKAVTGIILVAGESRRYGKNRNKNFELLNGKSVLSYSIRAFEDNNYIDNIIIVIRKQDRKIVENIIEKEGINKTVNIITGGKSREESVYNAIKGITSDIVVIHDGARPAIKQKYINSLLESMKDFKGATVGVKSKDTIKITDDNGIVISTTKRKNTWIIQTPQCFDRKVLLTLHEKFKSDEITDDCELIEKGGYKVKILDGDYTNIKITTSEDIDIIRKLDIMKNKVANK